MDLSDKLIELRIAITTACDGFSMANSNKETTLSTRLKILFLLSFKDMTPNELICKVGIAKSNLANLSKLMITEGVMDSYKTLENNRNVFYHITSSGIQELKNYKDILSSHFLNLQNIDELKTNIDKILTILKGINYD